MVVLLLVDVGMMEDWGVEVADLVELGHSVLQGLRDGKSVIQLDTESSGERMARRAEKIGRGESPTIDRGGVFEEADPPTPGANSGPVS